MTEDQAWYVWSGDDSIEFYACKLSEISTYVPPKARWTELKIFRTKASWVVTLAGMTTKPGEENRHNLFICHTPEALRRTLTVKRYNKIVLPPYAEKALKSAAEQDRAIREFLAESC